MADKHFALFYEAVPDILERRAPHRAAHLDLLKQEHDAGRLVLAGILKDGAPGSLLVFRGADDTAVRAFVEADPYVTSGLITHWTIREWVTVAGEGAVAPVN